MNRPAPSRMLRSSRGFSLSEMLVASAVFMLVLLAAYEAFQRSQESYRLGQNQAEMVQGARVAFEQMTNDLRMAGFEFDIDGDKERYPNQPDEPIEFMHRRAIVVRANFDFDKEFKGREPGLEVDSIDTCCPIVTTSNEEIVGFALGKSSGTQPTGSFQIKVDTTGTNSVNDDIVRDAIIDSDGIITGEETVTYSNVELLGLGDAGYAPPYTLYRFHLAEDGSVVRQPFIDDVYSLEFTFYDDSGNVVIGPGTPGNATLWGADGGRDARWSVRRIQVSIETMTPDADLRLKRETANTDIPQFEGRRLFTLTADILPPNLGRRGTRDRDINPPEPPRNVEICTGQCRMVRVAWDPGPPEDKVTDHVVTLCSDGPCEEDGSNFMAAFIVIANFDVTKMQEYAVFTYEDSSYINNGVEIWAKVIARNAAGTESECKPYDDTDCPTCCNSQAGEVVGEESRPGPFLSAIGGGYDPADAAFPDAAPDNASGMLIVTDPISPYFPPSLVSRVTLDSPRFALNRSSAAGTAPDDWTTKELGGGVLSASECHQQESTPLDATDDFRTPYNAFWRNASVGNTYFWRASATDSSTWDGAPNARSFVPESGNLKNFTHLPLTAGSATLLEDSSYTFTSTPHGWRYDGFGTYFFQAAGETQRPARAITPCEVYYYRFRSVTLCWDDRPNLDNPDPALHVPPNGVSGAVSAWSVASGPHGIDDYRPLAKSITPFYPPMLNAGDTTGLRDKADQSTHDSDDYGSPASVDTYATPSYTLPQRVTDPVTGDITAWIPPEAPSEFYMTRVNDAGTGVLTGAGNPSRYDARLIFNASRRTAPGVDQGTPLPAAYRTYRLYRSPASSPTPTAAEFNFDTANPVLVGEFDTIGPNDIRHYTMAGAGLVPPPTTFAPLADLANDWAGTSPDDACSEDPDEIADGITCTPYIYWLVTPQCTKFDDGIDTSEAEESAPSRPFLFPCSLHYDVLEIDVDPGTSDTLPNQVRYQPSILDGNDTEDCSSIEAARLLVYNRDSGEYVGSSDWRSYQSVADGNPDQRCAERLFPSPAVQQAARGGVPSDRGGYRFVVEVSTSSDDEDADEEDIPIGCRIRSDFGPVGLGPGAIPVACASLRSCGTQASPNIFGTVDETDIELENGDTVMVIRVPSFIGNCPEASRVDLRQLELKLEKSAASGDDDIPTLLSAQITAGVVGVPLTLPALPAIDACDLVPGSGDQDAGEDDPGEADLDGTDGSITLRWRDSFCFKTEDPDDDPCACEWDFPVLLASAPELTIRLEFDGSLCDVRLTQFNFRVLLDDAADADGDGVFEEELLCTQRPRRAADPDDPNSIDPAICPDPTPADPPDGPAGADPDLPIGCTLEGEGRGPALVEEVACGTCTENCEPCQCPLNDDDLDIAQDYPPTFLLTEDLENDHGTRNTQLELTYTQTTQPDCQGIDPPSPPCKFRISEIEIEIACGSVRRCDTDEPLGKLGGVEPVDPAHQPAAKIVFLDGSQVALPEPTVKNQEEPSLRYFRWTGVNIDIENDETFELIMRFDDSINGGNITVSKIRFSRPFAAECDVNGAVGAGYGPLCTSPTTIFLPYSD